MEIKTVPSVYIEGYKKAREYDSATADNYIRHTTIGDVELDPVMEEIASLPPDDVHRFIKAGIEQEVDILRTAPQALLNFFDTVNTPPHWLDHKDFSPAIHTFYVNVANMLVAFVTGVLIEGFTTLISKSFNITGRVASGPGDRRLKQNIRHIMEIFFPGGLQRGGDGWKITLRIRFIHARVRQLIANSDDWYSEAWGTPLSAAHIALASSVFSMRLLQHSMAIGVKYSEEEKKSILKLWRYVAYIMGVPETILFVGWDEAQKLFKIGRMCEPSADHDSVVMANSLIEAIPIVAGIEDPREQRILKNLAYGISRSLIGHELANQLQFPKKGKLSTIYKWKMMQALDRMLRSEKGIKSDNFVQILNVAQYDDGGISYRLPDHVNSSKSSDW